jgi:ketosteroid isomerase-like protein
VTESELRGFFDAVNAGDLDAISGRLAEDVVLEFPGRRFGGLFEGKRKVMLFFRQNRRLFRDGLRFTVLWAGVAGDRGVVQWTNEGVTRGGTAYANRGATVFETDGDRIVAMHDYLDTERMNDTWPDSRR